MKKLSKALVALATATAMGAAGFAGVSTAMGLTVDNTNNKTDLKFSGVVKGDTLTGYRLLDVVSVHENYGEGDPVNDKVTYVVRDGYRAFLHKVINDIEKDNVDKQIPTITDKNGDDIDRAIIDWLTNLNDHPSTNPVDIDTFATAFGKYVKDQNANEDASNRISADFTVEGEKAVNGVVSTDNVQQVGYYLVLHTEVGQTETVDKNNVATDNDVTTRTQSKNMVFTLLPSSLYKDGSLTIEIKNDTARLTKSMTNPTVYDAHGTGDYASYGVGDIVEYKVEAELPGNYADFDEIFYLRLADKMSVGLEYQNNAVVKVYEDKTNQDAKPVTVGNADANTWDKDNPANTAKVTTEGSASTITELDIDMGNVRKYTSPTFSAKSKVVVIYTAKITKDVTTEQIGNNEVVMYFSQDPTNQGETLPTPTIITRAVNFTLNVNKTDGTNPLDGAAFTLNRINATIVDGKITEQDTTTQDVEWKNISADKVPSDPTDTNSTAKSYTAGFNGLSTGFYKLEETKVPDGYNKAKDRYLLVEEEHENGELKGLKLTFGDGLEIKQITDGDAVRQEIGIANGTVLTNDGDAINLGTQTMTISIVNNTGKELPSTGGMGTTILYIIGGLIVLAAAGGLTVAVRKRNN